MGLINETGSAYYGGNNLGGYQFTSLKDVIDQFIIAYVGEDKIISKIKRTDVVFHAKRGLQEFSFDTFKSTKAYEISVPTTLQMSLPQDYVNYVKLVRVDSNGIERILYPTGKTSNPFPISQDADGSYNYTGTGDALAPQGATDSNLVSITTSSGSIPFSSDMLEKYNAQTTVDPYVQDSTDLEIDSRGRRYGLDPQHAQSNGTFFIDQRNGFIHFGSSLNGETIVLKYISDGLGTDEEMVVHKFCEEAVYKWIMYGLLSTRSNIPEHIVLRYKKEKFAETRKAKIRLSNIKMEEFTQILKGLSKPIK